MLPSFFSLELRVPGVSSGGDGLDATDGGGASSSLEQERYFHLVIASTPLGVLRHSSAWNMTDSTLSITSLVLANAHHGFNSSTSLKSQDQSLIVIVPPFIRFTVSFAVDSRCRFLQRISVLIRRRRRRLIH